MAASPISDRIADVLRAMNDTAPGGGPDYTEVVAVLAETRDALIAAEEENERLRTRGGIALSLLTVRQLVRFHERYAALNTGSSDAEEHPTERKP